MHWGWYWRVKKAYNPRKSCNNTPEIDSFVLYRYIRKTGSRIFTISALGNNSRFELNENDNFTVTCDRNAYEIRTENFKGNFGGSYYYFLCPCCNKRMQKLYLSGSQFYCRKCLKLSYQTQRMRPQNRWSYKSMLLAADIEKKGGEIAKYWGKKPKRMHEKTFARLCEKYEYFWAKSLMEYANDLVTWNIKHAALIYSEYYIELHPIISEYEATYGSR